MYALEKYLAILLLDGLKCVHRCWGSIRHCQIWHWNCRRGDIQARFDNEGLEDTCWLRNQHADAKDIQSLIPVVMAGIIAVYSLVIAVLIAGDLEPPPGQNYSLFKYVRFEYQDHFMLLPYLPQS